MSAFELKTTLPCDQAVWEATTPLGWKVAWSLQEQPLPYLLSVLKAYLTPSKDAPRLELNAISRVITLHGLMSFSWDMERRDQTSLGLLSNDIASGSWRDRLTQSYELWKNDFDRYTTDMKDRLWSTSGGERLRNFETYETTSNAMFHAANLVLLTNIVDLQIYGGARHILGRPVSKTDYARSQRVVKQWASRDFQRAVKATWHAASLLEDASDKEGFIAVDAFHHPWAVFLASLTLWTFYQARPTTSADQDDEMIWDASEHMRQLLCDLTKTNCPDLSHLGKNCTAGLTAVVVGHLSKVRWAVVHDGVLILRNLVPWRLIYEDAGRK